MCILVEIKKNDDTPISCVLVFVLSSSINSICLLSL